MVTVCLTETDSFIIDLQLPSFVRSTVQSIEFRGSSVPLIQLIPDRFLRPSFSTFIFVLHRPLSIVHTLKSSTSSTPSTTPTSPSATANMVTGKPEPFQAFAPAPSQPVAFSPPSKRDLTSWWRQFKKNTRREEVKGAFTSCGSPA